MAEHEVVDGVVESLKVITYDKSLRTAQYAFEFAYLNHRKKVSAIHKANIMKQGDGLFLKVGCLWQIGWDTQLIGYKLTNTISLRGLGLCKG